LNLIYQS